MAADPLSDGPGQVLAVRHMPDEVKAVLGGGSVNGVTSGVDENGRTFLDLPGA